MALEVHECPNRFVTQASWEDYLKFLEAVQDRRIRVTYDQGKLEIMTLSPEHEHVKTRWGMLLEMALIELGYSFIPCGSVTFQRQDLGKGMEPDECYWVARADAVSDIEELDLTQHPAPDLVLEVDISRSSLNRIEMYRRLGVTEVWRYQRQGPILVYRLQADGRYEVLEHSQLLPQLPLDELARYLRQRGKVTPRFVREFRQWLRGLV